ncbi:hypothetical protein G6F58_012807 [Rhizopus delemar]|nr:hypothetical protein G6F58_012807 [Rhizopus delemar]
MAGTTRAVVCVASVARAGVRLRDPDEICSAPAADPQAAGTAGWHAWRPVAVPPRGRFRRRSTRCRAAAMRSAGRRGRTTEVRPGMQRRGPAHRGPGHRRPGSGAGAVHEVQPARGGLG